MIQQVGPLWATLLREGVVQGKAPEEAGKLESPWYVKVLLAFSGWLAALFLLGFLGMGFEFVFRSGTATFIIGGMMIGGAFATLSIPRNEFVEHLALAASLAGQALVVYAIFKIFNRNEKIAWLFVTLLQAPLAVIMPSFVHRVFSSFFAAFAFSMALTIMGWSYIVSGFVMLLAALCWLNEFGYPEHMGKIRAIGYGLILALIQLKGAALFGYRTMGWRFSANHAELWAKAWLGELLIGVVTLYVVWHLLQRYNKVISRRHLIAAMLAALLLCLVSMKVQGITVGMVIMLLGFSGANRVLLSLGIVSLLFYISSYYYLLDATLLIKSQTLLIVGLVLLMVRWLMLRILPVKKEARHA
jgi:uncharacterized membrane protein